MTANSPKKTWAEHWQTRDIPWDAGKAAPSLIQLLKEWPLKTVAPPQGRALIPGCGSGYDVLGLAQSGFNALGLDIAPGAAEKFAELRKPTLLSPEQAQIDTKDFFTTSADALGGTFDFIWDYTFYCAIDPSLRPAWKKSILNLLAPQGILAMLLFPVIPDAPRDQGPPYPLDPECARVDLAPEFENLYLEPASQSHPGREGKEWLSLWRRKESLNHAE